MAIEKQGSKKRVLTSYDKLSDELLELFAQTYPHGYRDAVVPVTKPNGETIYAVRLETAEVSYLVRVEVKIDAAGDYYEEENDSYENDNEPIEAADQFADEKDDEDGDFD